MPLSSNCRSLYNADSYGNSKYRVHSAMNGDDLLRRIIRRCDSRRLCVLTMILSLITYGHILAGERLKVLDTKIATPVYQLILNSTGDFSGEQSFTMTALPTLADYRCSFGGIATGTMHFTVTDLSPYPWIVPKDDDGDLSCYATLEDAQKALLRPTAESRKSEARHRKDGFLGAMTKGDLR